MLPADMKNGRYDNMTNIAIVEDNELHAKSLQNYLQRFFLDNHTHSQITIFREAISFLENYTAEYDVIFMDISMPYLNGMDAAHRLRELDKQVLLLFVTSLAQYAVDGYEVDAFAYLVKPVSYPDFALKFMRVHKRLEQRKKTDQLVLNFRQGGSIRLSPEEIAYCEVSGHKTVFHSIYGDYVQHTTLSAVEKKLDSPLFRKCNHCYLVNLHYVKSISGDEITLQYAGQNQILRISRNKKKAFHDSLQTIWGCAAP